MPRILSDPSLIECPDYASDDHAAVRAPFINPNTTEEQAIQLLTNFWKAGNDSDRLKWVRQVEQDAEEVAERERLRTEAEATAARAQQVEVAAARMEEMKKNKSKYLPIPDRDVPTIAPVIAANYAIRRMEQGLYVDMYYYTNAGLRDALRDSGAVDDEAMVMLRQPNGGTGWTPAAAVRDSRSVVDDKDIAWEDFCQAAPRMIIAMEQAGWREERVRMLASFWGSLQMHELRSSPDPLDQKTLLVYQAEQRKQWHLAITSPGGSYNISRINGDVILKTRDRVYRENRLRMDNERDYRVRILDSYG